MSEQTNDNLFDKTFRDRDGNIVVGQAPNAPILVWCGATLLRYIAPSDKVRKGADIVSFGSITYWSLLELFDGVNYFRRALGAATLLFVLVRKFR